MSHYTVRLDRTIVAVREALPEDEVAEFNAAIESAHIDDLQKTFGYWFIIAVLNKAGRLEAFRSDRSLATGNGIPFDEAFPGYRERWEQERAQQAA
ncbi:hypothetical protein [Catenulispora sp. GP43]|uniref:hypothetical protein n=1 Tax=Catenulispora sp. GP43 TaxID=3156263 RepID=UPI0035176D35